MLIIEPLPLLDPPVPLFPPEGTGVDEKPTEVLTTTTLATVGALVIEIGILVNVGRGLVAVNEGAINGTAVILAAEVIDGTSVRVIVALGNGVAV